MTLIDLQKLNCRKAAGSDDICADYFKFAHSKLHLFFYICVSLYFSLIVI